jgi:hypothetical protein
MDIHSVTGDYMIRNIEFSFKVWQESPWNKNISFEDFCEDILPYRIGNEPIEDWKESYYNTFHPLVDSLLKSGDIETVCRYLCTLIKPDYAQGWVSDSKLSVPGLGALTMLKARIGSCREEAEMMVYVLRSLGIPAGVDMILQHVDHTVKRHYWNYIRDLDGKKLYIESFLFSRQLDFSPDRKYGKIYRFRYALQEDALPLKHGRKPIPQTLNERLLQDVSSEYFPYTHIFIHSGMTRYVSRGEIVYLNVYNGSRWIPIAWNEKGKDTIVFRHVEPDILYRLSVFSYNGNIPVTEPFILKGCESVFLYADTIRKQDMLLKRKYRIKSWWNVLRAGSIGGRFQGANRVDFSDATDLHVITDSATLQWTVVPVKYPEKFKNARYISSDKSHNNMAEIQFISNGLPLTGGIIGTSGSWKNEPGYEKEKALDGDPLTFFDSPNPQGDWVGLAFDSPQKIDGIRYLFRNDDNNIREGDRYELFYWDRGKWISLGGQVADTTILVYENVPSGALYWLHNHTRGKEERPFTHENGQQVWY